MRNIDKMCGDEAVTKMAQVESSVTRLASLTSSLHSALDRLTEKLRPVLRDAPPCEEGKGQLTAQHVPLAADLYDLGSRIEGAVSALRSLEERIEL